MIVKSKHVDSGRPELGDLGLGYLAFFLGVRVNQLVKERLQAAGYHGVRESHGYLIQHLIETERSITELAQRMQVTQQAASKAVAELAAMGMLEVVPGADKRSKTVGISAQGWHIVRESRRTRRHIERRLVRAAGAAAYEDACRTLSNCLEALGGMKQIRSRRVPHPE
jgi:DNA-binding MarR family transcriptional regulator